MNFKTLLLLGSVGFVLHGCTSMKALTPDSFSQFTSPQEVIDKKNINENNSSAKEYVYDWGSKYPNKEVQSLLPRSHLSNYCISQGGKFTLLKKSSLHLVKDIWAKKLLNTYSSVKQGIGAYQCKQSNGKQWYVSIEPLSERKLENGSRVVNLQTKILALDEVKKLYAKSNFASVVQEKKLNNNAKATTNNATKNQAVKALEEKKVTPPVEDMKEKEKAQAERVVSIPQTPQSQQMQFYTAARKDLSRGQNQINACNNAERAYNYGRLRNSSGLNVYAESGVLVAKCLTGIPSYSSRFSNPKDRAKRILQNLVSNQNHAVAKYMLKNMK